MGQGLYTLVGYGILNPPWTGDDDINDDLTAALMDLGLQTSHETEPRYLVIPLAVDDEVLQSRKLPALPEMLAHPRARTARVPPMNPVIVDTWVQGRRPAFDAMWQAAQQLYTEAGLTLGEPGLIILNDWH
jgi:hypothetical protein